MTRNAQTIFDQVCDLDAAGRDENLNRLCGNDLQLRRDVESLLAAHDAAGQFLQEPTLDPSTSDPVRMSTPKISPSGLAEVRISEGPGSVVDRYKLLEKIGEGGFGVVYMAQQSEPIRRRVALKIIKLGMDTKQVVRRFEAERQALALMDHPNIARVIDGGSTETGRPYFVMELVRGDPITEYCDQKRLPVRERLELFQQVCRAIEHAHQKGIIHRDIKPSNVLVTIADDKPLVKVIDFGIAKATSGELTNKTLFTEFRQLLGTPLYMSPEQAESSGVDIDTRTDVYSLGVLLYEVLTGRTPLDPKKLNTAAYGELQRMIAEDEPSKPSVMVTSSLAAEISEVAKRRGIEPSRLGQILRGDLDWIVLKAIDKDRSRRYSTASHFAADIERFLQDEAVEATPPSKVYLLRKFVRRNRGLIGTAAAIFLALVVGLVATSISAAWAIRSEQAARVALQKAEANERSARRAATLAGASLTLPEAEARSMAESWKAEIAESGKSNGKAEIVRMQTQYTTWFANWLMRNGHLDEASRLIDECYADAKRVVGVADPTFLALCNARVLVNIAIDGDAQEYVESFGDVMLATREVRGEKEASQLLPEYAAALVRAERIDDANEAVNRYLEFRKQQTEPISMGEITRLDLAINRILKWGSASHSELIRRLRDVRETGSVIDVAASQDNDPELARDLEMLQGRWRYKGWEKGKEVHMIVEFKGNNTQTRFLDKNRETIDGRDYRLALSRSGGVKVLTSYESVDPNNGGAFIYQLKQHQLVLVSGMLKNRLSLDEYQMRKFYRMKEGEED